MNRDNELVRLGDVLEAIHNAGPFETNSGVLADVLRMISAINTVETLPAVTVPTLAKALAVPEVRALVDAAEDILEQIRESNEMPISTIGLASALRQIGGEG